MKLTRREFLKASVATGGLLVSGLPMAQTKAEPRTSAMALSKTNHGITCVRAHLIPQQTYDPDRIKVPMKRTNPMKGRGIDPKFVPITWDERLNLVAAKMLGLGRNT